MTGQNVSRHSALVRRAFKLLAALAAIAAGIAPRAALGQGYPAPAVPFHGHPSGSATADVVNFNGRGAGVLWRGGHVAGDTVGRRDSISYISGMPYATFGNSLIFGDARFNYANRGGLAWSFGGGWRHYFSDVDAVLGLNGYFDRDQVTGEHFKAWGIGAELLSHNWEWRGNIYKPFDETRVQTGIAAIPGTSVFVGNELRFDQVRFFAAALDGYDTEIGFLLPGRLAAQHQVRAFGGAYYYETEQTEIPGWKARLQADITECLEANLQITNDSTFNTNVIFGIALELGGYKENIAPNNSRYRLGEPVRRNYTFTTADVAVIEPDVTAINPLTGLPFEITHVSSSAGLFRDGTVDFPYGSIQTGQANGNLVFVHGGSVWDIPPENFVTMQDDTRILGEGSIVDVSGIRLTEHFVDAADVGMVELAASPAFIASDFSLLRPRLSGSGEDTVTLADDVEFSGFEINSSGRHGIFGSGVENVVLNQNRISETVGDGVFLISPSESYQFIDTIITDTRGVGFHVNGGDAIIDFAQTEPEIDPGLGRIDNSQDLAIRIRNTTGGSIRFAGDRRDPRDPDDDIFGPTIDDSEAQGISIEDAAGNVTIDNLIVADSNSHGINITGGSGRFTFLTSIREDGGIQILRPTLNGVNIEGLQFGGEVVFQDKSLIEGRGGSGFNFDAIAGDVRINGDVVIDQHRAPNPITGVPGTGAAVQFVNNLSTGSVLFRDRLTISDINNTAAGGNDFGILISGNQFNPSTGARASFTAGSNQQDLTSISDVDGDNIRIVNDAAAVRFNGLTLNRRGQNAAIVQPAHGIFIENSTGRITFEESTLIENENNIADSAVEITTSEAEVFFDLLTANNTTGDAGVLLTDNIAGPNGTADIVFADLNVLSNAGTSLQLINNSSVRSISGSLDANPGTAVDILSSGIDLRFRSINADTGTAGTPFGILIQETFRTPQGTEDDSYFEVFGMFDGNAGDGGTIQNMTAAAPVEAAGAFLFNAGIVRLNQMIFEDNDVGVLAQYIDVANPPAGDPTQRPKIETGFVELDTSDFEENNIRAIDGLNIPRLSILNGRYEDNGDDAANGRETVRLRYSEDPSDDADIDDYEYPFVVEILQSSFENTTDDLLDIRRGDRFGDDTVGTQAHLELDITDSFFEATDATDPDGGDPQDDALIIEWEGPLFGQINGNTINLPARNLQRQDGIDLLNENRFDITDLEFKGNVFNIDNDFSVLGQRKFGMRIDLDGPGFIDIDGTDMNIDGAEVHGMYFRFDETTTLSMITNDIQSTPPSFDGFAIEVDRIGDGSIFEFDDNFIFMRGGDDGLDIDAFGVIQLIGRTEGNVIIVPNGSFFDFSGPRPRGQLLINGQLLPVP